MLLSRRSWLRGAAAVAAQASAPSILVPIAAHSAVPNASSLRGGEILPDPDFSLLHPTEPNIIGVRPHREGGVCLRLEDEPIASAFGPKFLIHNYGHGGAGITLSFGCASIVADHVEALSKDLRRTRTNQRVAVIGSGSLA